MGKCHFSSLDIHSSFSSLFSRLLTTAPLITDNALLVLRRYCQDEVNEQDDFDLNLISFFSDPVMFGNEYITRFDLSSNEYAREILGYFT